MKEHIDIIENYNNIKSSLAENIEIVAVSKFQSTEKIMTLYNLGHRNFGENYVQELIEKYNQLPKDIQWHFIGHLQSNKVKYIAPFIHLIHSVDSFKLLQEINKQALKNNRIINCLLQIHIAQEETKFGFDFNEAENLLNNPQFNQLHNIKITGLMGMATFTNNTQQIESEFLSLKNFYDKIQHHRYPNTDIKILSMGMSNDFNIAIQYGSNMVRLGTILFGERKIQNNAR